MDSRGTYQAIVMCTLKSTATYLYTNQAQEKPGEPGFSNASAPSTSLLELSEIITNYQYEMIIWNKQVYEIANYSYAADPLPISY